MAPYIILKVSAMNSWKNSHSANYLLYTFLGLPYSLSWSWIWIISSDFKLFAGGFWKALINSFLKWIQLIIIQKPQDLPLFLSHSLFFLHVFLSPLSYSGLEYKGLNSLGEEFHDSEFYMVDSTLLTYSSTQWFYYISTLGSIFTTNY